MYLGTLRSGTIWRGDAELLRSLPQGEARLATLQARERIAQAKAKAEAKAKAKARKEVAHQLAKQLLQRMGDSNPMGETAGGATARAARGQPRRRADLI